MIPGFNGVMDFSKEPGPADRRAFLEVPSSATHVNADAESWLPYAAASAATSFPEARPPVLLLVEYNQAPDGAYCLPHRCVAQSDCSGDATSA